MFFLVFSPDVIQSLKWRKWLILNNYFMPSFTRVITYVDGVRTPGLILSVFADLRFEKCILQICIWQVLPSQDK
jgi:hypothetical protein